MVDMRDFAHLQDKSGETYDGPDGREKRGVKNNGQRREHKRKKKVDGVPVLSDLIACSCDCCKRVTESARQPLKEDRHRSNRT